MKLFEPLDINGMVIPNRVMVPAMVTHLCEEGGMVNDAVIERYAAYAAGGAGLIVVEAMAVHQNKSGALLRASEDRFIPGLRELTRRVHETSDSKIVPQIIHFMKVARTGWRQTIDTLSTEEIATIVEQFGAAAARVQEAGFDGVELHSAHAYTLSSFLSRTNPRKDEYGGDTLEGRLTLIGQVMANVRRRVGKNFPVCVRFNAEEFIKNGYTVQESKLIAQRFAELGFDYLSLSAGGKFEAEPKFGVHFLITNRDWNKGSTKEAKRSNKLIAAESMRIKIISEDEFCQMIIDNGETAADEAGGVRLV